MKNRVGIRITITSLVVVAAMVGLSPLKAQEERRGPPGESRSEGGGRGFEGRPDGGPRGGGRPGEGPGGGGGPGGFGRVNPMMVALDTNKDGTLSKEEIENAVVALKTLDKNQDGKLTEDELRPSGGPPDAFGGPGPGGFGRRGGPGGGGQGSSAEELVARFMQFDANKDSQLSKDELSERMHGLITRADTNGDGAASKDELLVMATREMAGAGAAAGRGGPPGGRGGPPGGRGGERDGRPPENPTDRRPQTPESPK